MNESAFSVLRKINHQRCEAPDGFNHLLQDWSENDWGVAAGGEMGEMLNFLKKRRRGEDVPRGIVGKEIADIVIYLDLLANRMGLPDLGELVRNKFNETSDRIGCTIKLPEDL